MLPLPLGEGGGVRVVPCVSLAAATSYRGKTLTLALSQRERGHPRALGPGPKTSWTLHSAGGGNETAGHVLARSRDERQAAPAASLPECRAYGVPQTPSGRHCRLGSQSVLLWHRVPKGQS